MKMNLSKSVDRMNDHFDDVVYETCYGNFLSREEFETLFTQIMNSLQPIQLLGQLLKSLEIDGYSPNTEMFLFLIHLYDGSIILPAEVSNNVTHDNVLILISEILSKIALDLQDDPIWLPDNFLDLFFQIIKKPNFFSNLTPELQRPLFYILKSALDQQKEIRQSFIMNSGIDILFIYSKNKLLTGIIFHIIKKLTKKKLAAQIVLEKYKPFLFDVIDSPPKSDDNPDGYTEKAQNYVYKIFRNLSIKIPEFFNPIYLKSEEFNNLVIQSKAPYTDQYIIYIILHIIENINISLGDNDSYSYDFVYEPPIYQLLIHYFQSINFSYLNNNHTTSYTFSPLLYIMTEITKTEAGQTRFLTSEFVQIIFSTLPNIRIKARNYIIKLLTRLLTSEDNFSQLSRFGFFDILDQICGTESFDLNSSIGILLLENILKLLQYASAKNNIQITKEIFSKQYLIDSIILVNEEGEEKSQKLASQILSLEPDS